MFAFVETCDLEKGNRSQEKVGDNFGKVVITRVKKVFYDELL